MYVRCNAGVTTTNLMGWLRDYPQPVWYNPKGVANILSLYLLQTYYHVQYDSKKENSFLVTLQDGTIIWFSPTKKGLYAYTRHQDAQGQDAWAFINTVADKKALYTKHEYKDAVTACKVQNIIMFPGA